MIDEKLRKEMLSYFDKVMVRSVIKQIGHPWGVCKLYTDEIRDLIRTAPDPEDVRRLVEAAREAVGHLERHADLMCVKLVAALRPFEGGAQKREYIDGIGRRYVDGSDVPIKGEK